MLDNRQGVWVSGYMTGYGVLNRTYADLKNPIIKVLRKRKTDATQDQLFNHIFNANASTPFQTFNLSNALKIVKLKTLCIPVPATQVCLNVSQSIVCISISRLYIVPVCLNLPLDT